MSDSDSQTFPNLIIFRPTQGLYERWNISNITRKLETYWQNHHIDERAYLHILQRLASSGLLKYVTYTGIAIVI